MMDCHSPQLFRYNLTRVPCVPEVGSGSPYLEDFSKRWLQDFAQPSGRII